MATHYCSNPNCRLCRTSDTIDRLIYDLFDIDDREDVRSGNVWADVAPPGSPRSRRVSERKNVKSRYVAAIAFVVFAGMIVLSNWLLQTYGLIGPFPGTSWLFPAGTAAAAVTWPARDVLSRSSGKTWGPWIGLFAVFVGAGIAWLISPTLAVASATAYLASEATSWALFWLLGGQKANGPRYLAPVGVSTVVAAFVDSLVFLHLAGFFTWSSFDGLVLVKWLTVLAVGIPISYKLRKVVPVAA